MQLTPGLGSSPIKNISTHVKILSHSQSTQLHFDGFAGVMFAGVGRCDVDVVELSVVGCSVESICGVVTKKTDAVDITYQSFTNPHFIEIYRALQKVSVSLLRPNMLTCWSSAEIKSVEIIVYCSINAIYAFKGLLAMHQHFQTVHNNIMRPIMGFNRRRWVDLEQ